MTRSLINPLAGLFASQGGVQAQASFQGGAPQGNMDFNGNPNLSNQMASFLRG